MPLTVHRMVSCRIVALTGCLLTTGLSTAGCEYRGGLAPEVTPARILSLKPGMTYYQVVEVIGEPIAARKKLDLGQMAPTTEVERGPVILDYARPVPWASSHPMLWIHLQDGVVVDIYAKRGGFGTPGDEGVYGYSLHGRWGGGEEFHKLFSRDE